MKLRQLIDETVLRPRDQREILEIVAHAAKIGQISDKLAWRDDVMETEQFEHLRRIHALAKQITQLCNRLEENP